VLDLYVAPQARRSGLVLRLISYVADNVHRDGGIFLRGEVAGDAANRRLYGRSAVTEPGVQCTLSGRAFRTVAALVQATPRAAVRLLPDRAWNFQA
jgi:hypothetical protein